MNTKVMELARENLKTTVLTGTRRAQEIQGPNVDVVQTDESAKSKDNKNAAALDDEDADNNTGGQASETPPTPTFLDSIYYRLRPSTDLALEEAFELLRGELQAVMESVTCFDFLVP
ncbi:hypothetical protein MUK42_34207 [Musa troglodytarum]|uniref:Uncharacterized protein n=1 Tax=Musa troglodytarum TaxID=320322 RepID=A0A9E7JDF1_9LILI|nr:hypothetical protein MUK42_34207 [Musa troglodytarum]